MLPHPLTNFSRNKLTKIKDVAYVINLDEYKSIGTHWIVNAENVIYFYRFGVENIPKEIKRLIGNKNLITNIYKI